VYRIGFLGATSPKGYASQLQAFRGGLRDLGDVEGRNLVIEFRWAESNYGRLPELAVELVRWNPDVLVTHAPAGTLAAKRATSTIPIVMGVAGDAVATGRIQRTPRRSAPWATRLVRSTSALSESRREALRILLARSPP
jgi:putative ABC transport system substrate-binding protein